MSENLNLKKDRSWYIRDRSFRRMAQYTMASGIIRKNLELDLEFRFGQMGLYTQELGRIIKFVVKAV